MEEYKQIVEQLIGLLAQHDLSLIEDMQQDMEQLAERLEFERAAVFRNYIQALDSLVRKEEVMDFTEGNHQLMIVEKLDEGRVKLFLIKRTEILKSEIYDLGGKMTRAELVSQIKKITVDAFHTVSSSDQKEVTRYEIDKAQIIYSYLKSGSCRFSVISKEWLNLRQASGELEGKIMDLLQI